MRHLAFILALLTTPVLAENETIRLSEPVETTDSYEVFGAPLADKDHGISLANLIEHQDQHVGKEIRITTRIAKVCEKKGCFFIATQGDQSARITFADYGFFIPTDSGGKQATLVGNFSLKELTPEQVAHYQDDVGEAVTNNDQNVIEYSIVATSVVIWR